MQCYPIAVEERAEQSIVVGGELTAPNLVEPHLVFYFSPILFEVSPTLIRRLNMVNQSILKVITGPYG
jgi:hypothetical protein